MQINQWSPPSAPCRLRLPDVPWHLSKLRGYAASKQLRATLLQHELDRQISDVSPSCNLIRITVDGWDVSILSVVAVVVVVVVVVVAIVVGGGSSSSSSGNRVVVVVVGVTM